MKSHRVSTLVSVLVLFLSAVTTGAIAEKPSGLTPEILKELQTSFKLDAQTRALMNAMTNNEVKGLALNRDLYNRHEDLFDYKIDAKGITDQQKSGRCWLFAGLNMMRPAIIKKYNLSGFEFSQNHLFFWDKLEKANMFLEAVIETRDKPLDDRELEVLLKEPVPDGGWWSYVVNLIEKYGAVPKDVMPETSHSGNTGAMNALLNRLMRHDAAELRKLAAGGAKAQTLEARKVEMLKDAYRLIALHLGQPPEEFLWRYEDKDNKVHEATYTPKTFYAEAVGVKLGDYVSLFDHPGHPYDKYYRIKYSRNMQDSPDMDFVNLDVKRLKEYALASVLAGEPTWFAADVGVQNDGKDGIFEDGIYDYRSLLGMNMDLTKPERVLYFDSSPNHAMVFVGVDTLGAKPLKWLVENSWGTDAGNKGLWTMYDNWFDQYVYSVIINKKYLPADVLALLSTKPELLPAWDPMRELFMSSPVSGPAEDWAGLSKKLHDRCAKFNDSVKDISLSMEMTNSSSEGDLTTQSVLYHKGNRFRAEISLMGMEATGIPAEVMETKTVVIGDGTDIWMINPMMGKTQIPSSAGNLYRGQWSCSDYLPASAEIVGSETVAGHGCFVIAVQDETSDYSKLWIDKKSFSLIKYEGKPEEGQTTTAYFSDFKKMEGDWELPHKTEVYMGEELISTIVIKSVEVNKGLADDLFDPDKVEIKGSDMMEMLKKAKDQGEQKEVD